MSDFKRITENVAGAIRGSADKFVEMHSAITELYLLSQLPADATHEDVFAALDNININLAQIRKLAYSIDHVITQAHMLEKRGLANVEDTAISAK